MIKATVTLSPEAEAWVRAHLNEMQLLKREIAQSFASGKPVTYLKYQTGNAELDAKLNKPSGWPTAADVIESAKAGKEE